MGTLPRTIVVLAGVLVLGLVAGSIPRDEDEPRLEPARNEDRPPLLAPFRFRTGAERAWRLVRTDRVELDLGEEGGTALFHPSLVGRLAMRVVAASPEAARLDFAFLSEDGGGEALIPAGEAVRLRTVFSTRGELVEVRGVGAADPRSAAILGHAIEDLQFLLPEDRLASAWETEEENGTGRFRGRYRLEPDGRAATKSRGDYRARAGRDGATAAPRRIDVLLSEGRASWRPDRSWLDGFELVEELEVETGIGARMHAETRLSLEPALLDDELAALQRGRDDEVAGPDPRDECGPAGDLAPERTGLAPERMREILRGLLSGQTRPEHLDPEGLFLGLRRHPELAVEMGAVIRSLGRESRETALLLLVLRKAGRVEAEAEIRALFGDVSCPDALRLQALRAAARLEHPGPETVAATLGLAGERSGAPSADALLALGLMARRLDEVGDEAAPPLRARLMTELAAEIDQARQARLVSALGSTGSTEVAPVVAAALLSEHMQVRAAAARALADCDPEGAAPRLVAALADEETPAVRRQIARGLDDLPAVDRETLDALRHRLPAERDDGVRAAMTRILAKRLELVPEARALLVELVKTDSSAEVRRAAAAALRRR